MFNFNNISLLGDTSTKVIDLSKYGNNGTLMSELLLMQLENMEKD